MADAIKASWLCQLSDVLMNVSWIQLSSCCKLAVDVCKTYKVDFSRKIGVIVLFKKDTYVNVSSVNCIVHVGVSLVGPFHPSLDSHLNSCILSSPASILVQYLEKIDDSLSGLSLLPLFLNVQMYCGLLCVELAGISILTSFWNWNQWPLIRFMQREW